MHRTKHPRHYESAPICFQMFEIRNPKRDTNRMCTIKTYFCSIQMYLYNNSKTEPSKQVAAEVAVRGWGWRVGRDTQRQPKTSPHCRNRTLTYQCHHSRIRSISLPSDTSKTKQNYLPVCVSADTEGSVSP